MAGAIALIDMSLLSCADRLSPWFLFRLAQSCCDEVDLTDALVILTGQSTFRIELARLESSAHKKLLTFEWLESPLEKFWNLESTSLPWHKSLKHWTLSRDVSTAQCEYPVLGCSGTFATTKVEGFWSLLASCSPRRVMLSALQVFP